MGGISMLFGDKQVFRPYIDDDADNTYRDELGPYRGNHPALLSDSPVIFDQESTPPNPTIGLLAGSLTPDKGFWGTHLSQSHHLGKTRLVIYGDPKTGKPSSWTLFEWVGSGKKQPETNTEIYAWRRIPNAKMALSRDGFYESYLRFRQTSHAAPGDGGK